MPVDLVCIPGWKKFQLYKDRRPKWICSHLELLHRDSYMDLSLADRGFLHGLWMLAAEDPNNRARGSAYVSVKQIKRSLTPPQGHTQRILKRLNDAGFIQCIDTESVPNSVHREETERESPLKAFSLSKVDSAPDPQLIVSMTKYREKLNERNAG